jgi:hypothetical protein
MCGLQHQLAGGKYSQLHVRYDRNMILRHCCREWRESFVVVECRKTELYLIRNRWTGILVWRKPRLGWRQV